MQVSQKIIDYAIWYYLKYYPSLNKLREKLLLKFGENTENWKKYWWIWQGEIDYIINNRMKNIIKEEEVIIARINFLKNKWKSKIYIKSKLYERKENKELIEKYLEEIFVEWEFDSLKKEYEKLKWKNDKNKIIEKLIRKWFQYNDIKKIVF